MTFTELYKGITIAMRELDGQKKKDLIIAKAGVVLKISKASCDAFIAMAAELSSFVPGAKTAATTVKTSYDVASVITQTAATAGVRGTVDYEKAARDAAKAAAGGLDGPASLLTVTSLIKMEIVIASVNADAEQVKKSAAEYMYELGKYSLDVLDGAVKSGVASTGVPGKASIFMGIARSAFEYHQALGDAFDELVAESESAKLSYIRHKAQFMRTSSQLQKKIDDLQRFIRSCEAELGLSP